MSVKREYIQNLDIGDNDQSLEPYIGPRPFTRDKKDQLRFFGRNIETDEIVSLSSVIHKNT